MKVLVCGSRDFVNEKLMNEVLEKAHKETPFSCVVNGDAKGADQMSQIWAKHHQIPTENYPANWKKYGVAAGPIRNKQMLVEGKPEVVFAFYNNKEKSKGTKNMVDQARKAGLVVYEFE